MSMPRPTTLRAIATAILAAMAVPALAADDAEIRAQIQELRAQQAEIARLQRDNEAALRALEARLGVANVAPAAAPIASTPPPAVQAAASGASAVAAPAAPRLKLSGDLRVRGQYDTSDSDRPDRSSAQLRARLGATWRVNDLVSVGARLVTGDGDDPNSVDVQLSNWDDDLAATLDQAWLQLNLGDLKLFGGKMPQPFTRTELVWDGDVNPQGIAATWRHARADGSAWRANGLFFLVDERVAGADSTMLGVQFGHDTRAFGDWKFDASLALYDYSLKSVAGADSGDWRTNLLNPDGTYLSDFRLVDAIVGATWSGLGERWPLRLVGDVVKNTGARTDGDHGRRRRRARRVLAGQHRHRHELSSALARRRLRAVAEHDPQRDPLPLPPRRRRLRRQQRPARLAQPRARVVDGRFLSRRARAAIRNSEHLSQTGRR